jgi:hypothetical protein
MPPRGFPRSSASFPFCLRWKLRKGGGAAAHSPPPSCVLSAWSRRACHPDQRLGRGFPKPLVGISGPIGRSSYEKVIVVNALGL